MILLIEDELPLREVEAAYIRQAGYRVEEVEDGNTGLERFGQLPIELIVLDLSLPGMDGLEVCRRIRNRSNIPIIMVTARTTDVDELIGLETGADDYLKKPFNPNVLVARIRTLLRRTSTQKLSTGPFVIDPDKMQLTRHGRPIVLTTTQFNILYRLMERPGLVLTRLQLIAAAHPDDHGDTAIFDRTIDAHIKALRKRIEPEPSRPRYIQTVIGRGYKFAEPNRV